MSDFEEDYYLSEVEDEEDNSLNNNNSNNSEFVDKKTLMSKYLTKEVDCYVVIGCPRLALDWSASIAQETNGIKDNKEGNNNNNQSVVILSANEGILAFGENDNFMKEREELQNDNNGNGKKKEEITITPQKISLESSDIVDFSSSLPPSLLYLSSSFTSFSSQTPFLPIMNHWSFGGCGNPVCSCSSQKSRITVDVGKKLKFSTDIEDVL
jgi:hypothetical protein